MGKEEVSNVRTAEHIRVVRLEPAEGFMEYRRKGSSGLVVVCPVVVDAGHAMLRGQHEEAQPTRRRRRCEGRAAVAEGEAQVPRVDEEALRALVRVARWDGKQYLHPPPPYDRRAVALERHRVVGIRLLKDGCLRAQPIREARIHQG